MSPSDLHQETRRFIPAKRSAIKSTLAMPSHWVHMYDEFITKNAHQVSQIESTLRSLTYIIPGMDEKSPPPEPGRVCADHRMQAASATPKSPPNPSTAASSCSLSTTTPCSAAPTPSRNYPCPLRSHNRPPRAAATHASGPSRAPSTAASPTSCRSSTMSSSSARWPPSAAASGHAGVSSSSSRPSRPCASCC